MAKLNYKIAVVGASSLQGKEIADELADGALAAAEIVLLDDEDSSGKLEAVGDEATFLQRIEPAAFEGVDVAIFADAAQVREHWRTARQMNAAVVDVTGTLSGEPGVPTRSPLATAVSGVANPLDLQTTAIVAAHPVATMLALLLQKLLRLGEVRLAAATVLQPASEGGRAAMDELHQQTVSLLSFQAVPREIYDAQVAFNLLPAFGEAARVQLSASAERILADLRAIAPNAPQPLLQMVHAPVFHGYGISLFVEMAQPVQTAAAEAALAQDGIDLVGEDGDPPSNLSAAGQPQILLRMAEPGEDRTRLMLWLTADNLKLRAQTAVACAGELTRMRPLGKVQ